MNLLRSFWVNAIGPTLVLLVPVAAPVAPDGSSVVAQYSPSTPELCSTGPGETMGAITEMRCVQAQLGLRAGPGSPPDA